jgi:hypothetical protein
MARIEISVKGLFATPVAAVEVPGAAALNAELEQVILRRRSEAPSVQASNAGGWHSDRDIVPWGGAPIAAILDITKGVATKMTANSAGKPIRPVWTVQARGQCQRTRRRQYLSLPPRRVLVGYLLCGR